jgi:hypothetical protein
MPVAMDIDVMDPVAEDREVESALRPVVRVSYLSTAEVADCTCPDWCERDHDRD